MSTILTKALAVALVSILMVGMCQALCVNGCSFPCAAGGSGRWEGGNPDFGFPLFHRPQFFFVLMFIS
jgi:hypothetical protein